MLVFAYGSLIWNPGFDHVSTMPAMAPGWRRSWCIPSTVHRGSSDFPGVVLGLVPGTCCVGIAYEVEVSRKRMSGDTCLTASSRRMATSSPSSTF